MSNNQEPVKQPSPESKDTFLAKNQKVLKELMTFSRIVSDSLNIGFIEVNLAQDRTKLVEYLQQQLNNPEIQLIVLDFPDPDLQFLRDAIVAELKNIAIDPAKKLVLLITGLEKAIGVTEEYPKILVDLNYIRDDLRNSIPHPILFLLPEYALTRLANYAPDFWAWGRKVFSFRAVQSEVDSIAKRILFVDDDTDNFKLEAKQKRIELLYCLLSEYQAKNKILLISKILNQLGDIYYILGDYQEVFRYYQQALDICRKSGDFNGEAISLSNLGLVYSGVEKYQQSTDFHRQSLTIAQEIDDLRIQAISLVSLGNVYNSLGGNQESIDYSRQSLTIAQEINDYEIQAASLVSLGNAYNNVGRSQESIDYSQKALTIAIRINNYMLQAVALNSLGISYNRSGKYKQAVDYYKQSLTIIQELGDRKSQAISLINLGGSFQNLKQISEAKEAYQQGKKIFVKLELEKDVARCDRSLKNLGHPDPQ